VKRVFVIIVAAAVLVWLGVMERAVRLQAGGTAAAEARDFDAADRDFRGARLLNPDTTPDAQRAFVYQAGGRSEDAVALLEEVVRREPDNLQAWGLLYAFTRERDPGSARRALEARRRLDPSGAR
jgi:cytochrome c-type biogenesis protein CcmH/NrfG